MTRTDARQTTTLAAIMWLASAVFGLAQTLPETRPAAGGNQDPATVHLTAARDALSDVTQLPAAGQLTGDARVQVQQLIGNFNELIAKRAEWTAPYAKVQANLAALLGTDEPARTSGTTGAVGTSGPGAPTLDPSIRAKLVEFRGHLQQFESVVGVPSAPAQAPPAAGASMIVPGATPAPPSAATGGQDVRVVAKDLLNHVEAVEVILGAQTAAQAAATSAAGGAVVAYETVSGSTRTTVTGHDVTLNASQLSQIRTHLKELRRLLEKK